MSALAITAERLRSVLSYDPLTGAFTWRVRTSGSINVGDVAGSNSHGYIKISVMGREYRAHRLAWLSVHGQWPSSYIDHIDGNKSNNAIANLRDVTQSINQQNQRRARSDSTHGFLGVARCRNRWQARIRIDGKRRHIGAYDTPELAHAAYIDAKRELHEGNTL